MSYLQQLALVVLSAALVDALAQESVEPLQLLQAVAGALLHHQVQEVLGGVGKSPRLLDSSPLGLSNAIRQTRTCRRGGRFKVASRSRASEDDGEGCARLISIVRAQFTFPLASLIKTLRRVAGHFNWPVPHISPGAVCVCVCACYCVCLRIYLNIEASHGVGQQSHCN